MTWSMTGYRSLGLRGSQLPRAAGNAVSPGGPGGPGGMIRQFRGPTSRDRAKAFISCNLLRAILCQKYGGWRWHDQHYDQPVGNLSAKCRVSNMHLERREIMFDKNRAHLKWSCRVNGTLKTSDVCSFAVVEPLHLNSMSLLTMTQKCFVQPDTNNQNMSSVSRARLSQAFPLCSDGGLEMMSCEPAEGLGTAESRGERLESRYALICAILAL
jgi:hypothetical protein